MVNTFSECSWKTRKGLDWVRPMCCHSTCHEGLLLLFKIAWRGIASRLLAYVYYATRLRILSSFDTLYTLMHSSTVPQDETSSTGLDSLRSQALLLQPGRLSRIVSHLLPVSFFCLIFRIG